MKISRSFYVLPGILCLSLQVLSQKTFSVIDGTTGKINQQVVSSLSPSLRALAAYYSAVGGTDCIDMKCALTTALGLGEQGSEDQKKLIQQFFPTDKAARLVLAQNCYLPPGTSSSFSNFKSLKFIVKAENITVNYQLVVYNHGSTSSIDGPDIFQYHDHIFTNKKRVLYAWTDKK